MESADRSGIHILAVEDDPIYAESLAMILEELAYEQFDITDNARDALRIFMEKRSDLVLADIEIKGPMNGIELVDTLSAIRPVPVVYITAFTDPAVFKKAKETRPAAYVVKPYHATNLQAAMELALLYTHTAARGESPVQKNATDAFLLADTLFVKHNSRLFKLRLSDILFIEVNEKYCSIITSVKRLVVNMRLKNLLDQLPANQFVQVHRSYAVRIEAIEEIHLEENMLKMGGKEIPVGRMYRDALFAKLKMI